MELTNLFALQDKLLSDFKVDLDREIEAGRTLNEDEMYDYISEWADGKYPYYSDQYDIAIACRFSAYCDFGHIWEEALSTAESIKDIDDFMGACTTMFVEHCIREQFAGYEVVADEEVA